MKVGDIIKLPDNKRDMALNKVGGLYVEILSITDDWDGFKVAEVKIKATGNTTKIIL